MTNKPKDNKMVSIAALLLRLFIGWRFLSITFLLTRYIDVNNTLQLIGLIIIIAGGVLLILGLFTRWAAGLAIVYFLLTLVGYDLRTFIGTNLVNIIILLFILLLGPGRYSLDWHRSKDRLSAL